jgi:predicted Zn finger-like uncharacterized protein
MPETIQARCPNCRAALQVPVTVAGKKIRCKNCQTVFTVSSGPAAPPPGKAAPVKPAPVKAKPVQPTQPAADTFKLAEPPKPAEPEKIKRPFDEDEDTGPAEYIVGKDDLDIPRCPFCAKELDPPDTMVCLNCGFDLLARRRHDSRKVYELSTGDYVMHYLPGIGCVLAIGALIFLDIFCWMNMEDWFRGSILETDDPDPNTGKKKLYLPPGMCVLWIIVPSLYIIWKAGVFSFRRFVINWRPPETIKK